MQDMTDDESRAIEFVARMVVGTKYLAKGLPAKYTQDIFSDALYFLSQVSDEEVAKAYAIYHNS